MEYNFVFLENLFHLDDETFEKRKLMNKIDSKINNDEPYYNLLNTTYCLFSSVFLIGFSSYIYNIYTLIY
jgi:hypothetical protein